MGRLGLTIRAQAVLLVRRAHVGWDLRIVGQVVEGAQLEVGVGGCNLLLALPRRCHITAAANCESQQAQDGCQHEAHRWPSRR